MKRIFTATALLAATTIQANTEAALNNNEVLTKIPDAQVLRNSDKGFVIDAKTLLSLVEDPDPAMNNPDKVAWELFIQVNAPAASAGNNNVLFETWASDDDTFTATPVWPGTNQLVAKKVLRTPALVRFAPKRPGLAPHVLPGGSEETRRNKSAFDFIKDNKLFTRAGLKAAFAAKKDIQFPLDAIEVKANWVPAAGLDPAKYHINTASDGQKFALVSMHVISKQVPNWTWATFEHQDNKGRCDFIGCRDAFGTTPHVVKAKTPTGGTYPACPKTPGLTKMMTAGKLDAVFSNYCLKGSQVDFVTATGLPTLLGNSVTETGFVNTSSCITCHSRASIDANGGSPQGAGFLNPPIPAVCPTPGNCSPNGTPNPAWFWNNPGKPNQSVKTLQTDFVWAIPLMAID